MEGYKEPENVTFKLCFLEWFLKAIKTVESRVSDASDPGAILMVTVKGEMNPNTWACSGTVTHTVVKG